MFIVILRWNDELSFKKHEWEINKRSKQKFQGSYLIASYSLGNTIFMVIVYLVKVSRQLRNKHKMSMKEQWECKDRCVWLLEYIYTNMWSNK